MSPGKSTSKKKLIASTLKHIYNVSQPEETQNLFIKESLGNIFSLLAGDMNLLDIRVSVSTCVENICMCVKKEKKIRGLNVLMSYKCLSNNVNFMINISCSNIQSK